MSFIQGLLRLILFEAQNLVAKDNIMGGLKKGKSDPYAKISVGEVTFKSAVVKENLNPVWNEMYEVCLKQRHMFWLYNNPQSTHLSCSACP